MNRDAVKLLRSFQHEEIQRIENLRTLSILHHVMILAFARIFLPLKSPPAQRMPLPVLKQ